MKKDDKLVSLDLLYSKRKALKLKLWIAFIAVLIIVMIAITISIVLCQN